MSIVASRWLIPLLGALLVAPTSTSMAASPAPDRATFGCGDFQGGDHVVPITVAGTEREVLVHAPPGASKVSERLPAVIAFHGYSARATELATTSGLSSIADEDGFLVLYPQAAGQPPDWHFPGHPFDPPGDEGDLALVGALLDVLDASPCVDATRVFLIGHSMGGGMAAAAGCRFSERLAGIELVSATYFGGPCAPSRPIPVLALHAVDDEVLPYAGGPIIGTPSSFPHVFPVEDAVAAWSSLNGCAPDPTTTASEDGTTVLAWQDCLSPVVLYRLPSGGHAYAPEASPLLRATIAG